MCLFSLCWIKHLCYFFTRKRQFQRILCSFFFFVFSGETFSENFSHTDKCQPCTECTGLLIMKTPCTDSNDATCACNYGYYMNMLSGRCEPCTMCSEGHGVLFSCELNHDTVCEECVEDTYSDQESLRDPCIPCTSCDDSEILNPCTSVTDTVCQGKTSHPY